MGARRLLILKPREMFSLLLHVARPEGRVHFAGEHASAWPGWMQGRGIRQSRRKGDQRRDFTTFNARLIYQISSVRQ